MTKFNLISGCSEQGLRQMAVLKISDQVSIFSGSPFRPKSFCLKVLIREFWTKLEQKYTDKKSSDNITEYSWNDKNNYWKMLVFSVYYGKTDNHTDTRSRFYETVLDETFWNLILFCILSETDFLTTTAAWRPPRDGVGQEHPEAADFVGALPHRAGEEGEDSVDQRHACAGEVPEAGS
jgi:hypothetical protein